MLLLTKRDGHQQNIYIVTISEIILGDMVRTEYRIQFNKKKDFHYKGPLYSLGKLKKKEFVYKHT